MSALRRTLTVMALLAAPSTSWAQSVRITGTTTMQYLDMRQLVTDSIDALQVPGSGILRSAPDGSIVRCVANDPFCRFLNSGGTVSTLPVLQDLTVSAWGLGRGVRVYARLRSRGVLAGADSIWPQETDHLDVMVAYAELSRARYRVRAGRQWTVSGLGYYNFDGGSALLRAGRGFTVEGWAGQSLARGLNEPLTSAALAAVESFHPDDRAWILGGRASWRAGSGRTVSALYQREIRSDRKGLYSERVALDGVYRTGWGQLEGSMEADVASKLVNEATLRARYDLTHQVAVTAFARQYRPFFELWTIWGAFDPVGFNEAGLSGSWRSLSRLAQVQAHASFRRYPDAATSGVFGTYRNDGWRLGVSGALGVAPTWNLQGSYLADVGFGAAKSQSSLRLQHTMGEGFYVAASATAFQTSYELRVPKGTVWGLGGDAAMKLSARTRVSGSGTWYHHANRDGVPEPDWSQVRATLRLDWTVGPEPGMAALVGGAR